MKKDMDLQEALDNIGERLKQLEKFSEFAATKLAEHTHRLKHLEVANEVTNLAIRELVGRTEILRSHTHRLKGLENHVNSLQDLHKLAVKADDTLFDALNSLADVVRTGGLSSAFPGLPVPMPSGKKIP